MQTEVAIGAAPRGRFEHRYPPLAHLVDTGAVAYSLLTTHLPFITVKALGLDRGYDERSRQ